MCSPEIGHALKGKANCQFREDSETYIAEAFCIQGAGLTSQNSQGSGINEGVCFTLNALDTHGVAYAIDSLSSNSMKSSNPHSGFHETDKAKTLDCTGPDPTKNQGGVAICQAYAIDGYNAQVTGDVAATMGVNCGITTGRNGVIEAYAIDCRNATINPDVNGTLQAKEGGGYNLNTNNVVMVEDPIVLESNQEPVICIENSSGNGVCGTLDASYYKGPGARSGKEREYIAVCFDARGNGDGKTVPTITGDHENRVTDYTALAVERASVFDGERRHNYEPVGDTHPTLQAAMGTGGGNTSIVVEKDAVAFTTEMTPKTDDKGVAFSLKQRDYKDPQSVAYCVQNEIRWIVRRLTPLECERLQGFPDGWTDIGDWVDTKGKTHKAADSPRYKALGNSIAVGYANNRSGFWCWLMKRISGQFTRTATLGSLFDGIGGFPLAWEAVNGRGTARWASEIEEFPIAVTKYHFPEEETKC